MLKPYHSVHCLFCTTVFGNSNLAPGHLKKNMKSHPSRSVVAYYMPPRVVQRALFEASLESHCRQLSSFENNVIKE